MMFEDREGWIEGTSKHGKEGSCSFILPVVNMELLAFTDFTLFCTYIEKPQKLGISVQSRLALIFGYLCENTAAHEILHFKISI